GRAKNEISYVVSSAHLPFTPGNLSRSGCGAKSCDRPGFPWTKRFAANLLAAGLPSYGRIGRNSGSGLPGRCTDERPAGDFSYEAGRPGRHRGCGTGLAPAPDAGTSSAERPI